MSDAVAETEGVRKGLVWPVLILAMVFTVVFVIVGIGTYECVTFGHSDCDVATCCVTPCTVFVAVVIWLCAASAVALSGENGLNRQTTFLRILWTVFPCILEWCGKG